MKHCAVTLAMKEPVSDHNTSVCKVCHINLKEFDDTFKGMRHMRSALRRENLISLGREEVLTLTEICQQRMHGYLLILWFLMTFSLFLMTFIMIFGHEMVA